MAAKRTVFNPSSTSEVGVRPSSAAFFRARRSKSSASRIVVLICQRIYLEHQYVNGGTNRCTNRMSQVGIPGALVGLQKGDATIAQPLGDATTQFGENLSLANILADRSSGVGMPISPRATVIPQGTPPSVLYGTAGAADSRQNMPTASSEDVRLPRCCMGKNYGVKST